MLDAVIRCPRCQRRVSRQGLCPVHGRPTAAASVAVETPALVAPRGWELGEHLALGGSSVVVELRGGRGKTAVMKWARWAHQDLRERFATEASVLRAVGAPATPKLLDAGTRDGWPFLVMEHIAGETLAQRMAAGAQLHIAKTLAILTRLAEALGTVHAAGFVHRDLKPENVMVTGDGVRLLDFGLACRAREGGFAEVGSILGTVHYLAPEQIRGGAMVDHRADLYSFGVIAYEMLSGQPPFTGERRAIEYQHQFVRPAPLAGVPRAVNDLVLACMAKEVDARPQTAAEIERDLRRIFEALRTLPGLGPRAQGGLGAADRVALAWISCADASEVVRAVTDVHGVIVRQVGDAILAAFSAQHHEQPTLVALAATRDLANVDRIAIHETEALVRRTAQGRLAIYGTAIDEPQRWLPAIGFSGLVLTDAAAHHVRERAVPATDVPGFWRDAQRARREEPVGITTLVGRDGERREVVTAATSSPSRLISITGAAGAGKTRLLGAIAADLRAAGREVLEVRARRQFPGEAGDDADVCARLGGGEPHAVLVAAGVRGAIVIVDDIHATSSAFRRALVRPGVPGVRIVASPAPLFAGVDQAIAHTARELPPLDAGAAGALLRELLQPVRLIPSVLIERLAIRAMGSPSLLIALAHELRRRGAIRRHGSEWYIAADELDTLLAPPGASWLATGLLDDLPRELDPVVRACAALGPAFRAGEIAHVTRLPALEDRIAALVARRVLVEEDGALRFAHAAVQDAIYHHTLDTCEAVHDRALGYALEHPEEPRTRWLARIAHHASGAVQLPIAAACWTALAADLQARGELEQVPGMLARALHAVSAAVPPQLAAVLDP